MIEGLIFWVKMMWTVEDQEALKEVRRISELDRKKFARYYCISEAQLIQLEEGGNSYFYSEAIKYAAGKKLLSSCGMKTKSEILSKAPVNEDSNPVDNMVNFPAEEAPSIQKGAFIKKWYFGGVVAIFAAIGFLYYWQGKNSISSPVISDVKDNMESKSAPLESNDIKQENSVQSSMNAAGQALIDLPSTDKQSTDLKEVDSNKPSCSWTENPVPIQANNPSKSGKYIHFHATDDVFFCVKDSAGYSDQIKLNANKGRSITGVAPFKVYSSGLNNVKIFYQGSKLVIPNSDIHEISISEIIR